MLEYWYNNGTMKLDLGLFRVFRWIPQFLVEARSVYLSNGARGVIQRYGWKILALLLVYYLVRDSIIYLLLPYLVIHGVSK